MKKPLKALMNITHVNIIDGSTRNMTKAEVKRFQSSMDELGKPENIAIDFLNDLLSDSKIRKKYLMAQIINNQEATAFIFRMMASRGSNRKKISKEEQKFKVLFDAGKIDLSKHGKRIQEQCLGFDLDLGQTTIRKLKIKYG